MPTLSEALTQELELTGETVTAYAARSGVFRQTLSAILAGADCRAQTLKLLEAASSGRIGLHSVAIPERANAVGE